MVLPLSIPLPCPIFSPPTHSDFEHFFFLGAGDLAPEVLAAIVAENATVGGDIVLLANVSDLYGQLTTKVLAAFSWISRHRPHAEAVYKVQVEQRSG